MRKSETISSDLHDILAGNSLPDIMVQRDLAHDALQFILYARKRMLELEADLDLATDARKKDRRHHLETFGRMIRVLKRYQCDCDEECEDAPEDASYCGWDAKRSVEGKI